jgi:peptidoglycan/xylan/chitin deacetylase (PgdA/CDA1 family)
MERTQNHVMRYHTGWVKLLFPSIHCKVHSSAVYLTFDDGPHPVATPAVLNILQRFNIKATFFFLGKNILQYPNMVREVIAAGHTIGNHGFSHNHLIFKNQSYIKKEITDTAAALQSVTGRTTTMFRPPYGDISCSMLRAVRSTQHQPVLWARDIQDWSLPDESMMLHYLQGSTQHGDIILLHDNELTALRLDSYLPKMIETLSTQHFTFSALTL